TPPDAGARPHRASAQKWRPFGADRQELSKSLASLAAEKLARRSAFMRPMRSLFSGNQAGNQALSDLKPLPIALAAAVGLSLAATIVSLRGEPGFDAVRLGHWSSWPRL